MNIAPVQPVSIMSDFEEGEAYIEVKVQEVCHTVCHTFVLNKKELIDFIDDLNDTLSLMS